MTAQQQACKIRRTWFSFRAAYPLAADSNVARMVSRRLGVRIETVLATIR